MKYKKSGLKIVGSLEGIQGTKRHLENNYASASNFKKLGYKIVKVPKPSWWHEKWNPIYEITKNKRRY